MSRKVILDPMDPVANELHQMVLDDPVARRAFFQQRALRSLGEAMRAAREDAGMTQTQLAESAGMTQAEISRIENALGGLVFAATSLFFLGGGIGLFVMDARILA